MAICYRLFRRKYSPTDAKGSYLAGGRWNPKGTRMLYASSTLSLACLEVLVHIKEIRLPVDYGWVKIEIPTDLIDPPFVTTNWKDEDVCQRFGWDWISGGHRPAVEVPSVIIPTERNLLLNPEHGEFGVLSFSDPEPFYFDPRLLKLRPVAL